MYVEIIVKKNIHDGINNIILPSANKDARHGHFDDRII